MDRPVSPCFVLRIRSEPDLAAWRPYRWAMYLLTADIAPLTVAGALYFGGGFGLALLGAVTMSYAIAVLGVEVTIGMEKKPQFFEFDSHGIRAGLGDLVPRFFPWAGVSSVRVRTGGRRRNPTVAMFLFRSRLQMCAVGVDLLHHRDVGEKIAAAVARSAPQVRRRGSVDVFSWDAAMEIDGEIAMRSPSMEPIAFALVALLGTGFGAWLTFSGFLIGIALDPWLFSWMAAAYIILGMLQVGVLERTILSIERGREPAWRDRRVQVVLAVAVALVGVEGLLAIILPAW